MDIVEILGNIESRAYYKLSYTRPADYFEAFILTWPGASFSDVGWNQWSGFKQEAVWKNPTLSNNKKDPKYTAVGQIANILNVQAIYYQEFRQKVKAAGGTTAPQDATVKENVKKNVSYGNEYVVGPFQINYISGNYTIDFAGSGIGLSFGGISDMYIVGEHTKRIEIDAFIINNERITPQYFKPEGEGQEGHLTTPAAQQYPKPGEKFYVVYKLTNDEEIEKIHAEFSWMEAEATLSYYDATKYKTSISCRHPEHCHGHKHTSTDKNGHKHTYTTHCGGCCYNCIIASADILSFDPGYQQLLGAVGTRTIKKVGLDIIVPRNNTPETNRNLQIKLAGHVWEDEKSGKESLVNGVKDTNEKMMPGVEVFLHYENGNLVTKNGSGDRLVNPTVTDENGYYEFLDLNAHEKYYIEFVYNGQTYQPTNYTDNLSGGYSNATEIRNDRLNMNNNFAEIVSAPENYKVRRKLYYEVGQPNKSYIINKYSDVNYVPDSDTNKNTPGYTTPYGIKEIYDYVIERAMANKNYSSAYNDALNKFGNNDDTKSKLQFIEDLRISSYTGQDTSRKVYPIYDNFVEDTQSKTINGVRYHALYPEHLNIDFGLTKRETFDLALRKDVQKATIEINGKSQVYTYDTRNNNDEADEGTWDINVRLADAYYNARYSREVFGSDYQYKASNYGEQATALGKSKEDELNVYVTYKLTVRNQSQSILGEVMELVDYYDEDYEYINERSYIEIKNGNNKGEHAIQAFNESRYGAQNQTTIAGYNAVYVRGLEGIKLTSGQTAYVYLTFRVKKDNLNGEDWIKLDEKVESAEAIGVGKENIAEINGFRTYYNDGTTIPNVGRTSDKNKVAGLFDIDSVPGNLNPNDVPKDGNINYDNFEDDTDKAPNIRLILYRENGQLVVRTMDGIVWEDERNEINKDQKTAVGDGIKQNDETAINGVTVQLVELMNNGTEFIWKQFSSGQNHFNENDVYDPIINVIGESGNPLIPADTDTSEGKYIFKSYMAGNYVVRFIYGDTVKTVLPNTATEVTNAYGETGQNSKSYNGQDYKSTTYQEGIEQNNAYVWREKSTWENGNETLGNELTTVTTFKPDASNNEVANPTISAAEQKGYLYDITASDVKTDVSDAKDIMSDNNVNNPNYRQNATLNSRNDVIDYSDNDMMNYIAEVLISHGRLPLNNSEISAKLQELMTETQMTAETGLMNIEVEYDRNSTENQVESNNTTYHITNLNLGLEERPKAELSINKEVTNVRLTLADGSTLFDATQRATNVLWRDHKPYEFKYENNKLTSENPIQKIRDYDAQYGLIQLNMDEELMHGATIKISYKVTVSNKGEVDYKENSFYYTGNVADKNTIVKTEPNQLVDYVANNLQFYAIDNEAWRVIPQEELLNGLVNMTLANDTAKYNTVITTTEKSNIANSKLVPEIYGEGQSSASDDLVLTQLITSENETDDLTYRNIIEIVRTSNDVGRRNNLSVAGNQNPTAEPTEVDTDRAEVVKIMPPYGTTAAPYIILAITILSSAILITGIIFIKKKVLK